MERTNYSNIFFLTSTLSACLDVQSEREIKVDPEATCGVTLMDNLQSEFAADVARITNDGVYTPFVDLKIDQDAIDFPEEANALVPGDLNAIGVTSYDKKEDGFVTSYLENDEKMRYFYNAEAGTACNDNTFAYNFNDQSLLVTGKCEWEQTQTGWEGGDKIGTCYGNLYQDCPYEENKMSNYSCTLLTGYGDAQAEIYYINK